MKKIFIAFAVVMSVLFSSCTEQERIRSFGGEMSVELPKGKKLIMATWKDYSLFYLLEDMEEDYVPKNKEFIEDAAYGIWESKITFIESR